MQIGSVVVTSTAQITQIILLSGKPLLLRFVRKAEWCPKWPRKVTETVHSELVTPVADERCGVIR
jgi:hypothetical protein